MRLNVLSYLEESAAGLPEACAVVDERGSLTYAELMDNCRRVGSALAEREVLGCGVLVCMEKSMPALVAQLGVLYAGGFYVPVDPDIPAERLGHIVEAVGETLVVVDETTAPRLVEMQLGVELVPYESLSGHEVDEAALADARSRVLPTMPAYTLFTSGSTGVPKGVVISHQAIISFIGAFVPAVDIRQTDRLGNQAPFDFDVSTKDIYSTLATGATLVIIPRRLFMQPVELVHYLERQQVTVLIWAVAALCLVSTYHALGEADLSRIRAVMFSGETMPLRHLKAWRKVLPEATFVNLYGPTEITCNCLYHVLSAEEGYEEGIPLGVPFAHCGVVLVDENGHEVTETGVEGELLVRGASLALGYLANPEQTERVFTQSPANPHYPDRVYHTGDVAKLDAQGRLIFCGRRDNQVKYLGHRIELEEIDLAFERMEGVEQCRCVFDDNRKFLRGFYTGEADPAALAASAREALPPHMVPATLRHLDAMPLTKNGKVDRKALAESTKKRRG